MCLFKSVLIQKCAYSKVWICWLVTRLVREAEYTHHKWGCAHDKGVLTAYQHQQETHHRTLKVSSSGFVKSAENLHVGASPDGIINCDCCWRRILEVKCPFSCVFSRSHPLSPLSSYKGTLASLCQNKIIRTIRYNYKWRFVELIFTAWRENELVIKTVPIDGCVLTVPLEKATITFNIYSILLEVLGKLYSGLPDYANMWEYGVKVIADISDLSSLPKKKFGALSLWGVWWDDQVWQWTVQNRTGLFKDQESTYCRGKWFCPECSKRKEILK